MSVLRTRRAGEGEAGTHLTCWVHSRPAWEAEAEFHAIPVPEQQVEHLRGRNPRAAPALLLASSQLILGPWPVACQVGLWVLLAVGAGKSGPLPKGVLGSGGGARGTYGQTIFFKLLQLSWRGTLRRASQHILPGDPPIAEHYPPGLCDKTEQETAAEMPWCCGASRSRDVAMLQAQGQLWGVIET